MAAFMKDLLKDFLVAAKLETLKKRKIASWALE